MRESEWKRGIQSGKREREGVRAGCVNYAPFEKMDFHLNSGKSTDKDIQRRRQRQTERQAPKGRQAKQAKPLHG